MASHTINEHWTCKKKLANLNSNNTSTKVLIQCTTKLVNLLPSSSSSNNHNNIVLKGGRTDICNGGNKVISYLQKSHWKDTKDAVTDFTIRSLLKLSFNKQFSNEFKCLGVLNARHKEFVPYVLERSDVWCDNDDNLNVYLWQLNEDTSSNNKLLLLGKLLDELSTVVKASVMKNIASLVLQNQIRNLLGNNSHYKAVAFIGDGSIIPRSSGSSCKPMSVPPAVPFEAPEDSRMCKELAIDLGLLSNFVEIAGVFTTSCSSNGDEKKLEAEGCSNKNGISGLVTVRGLLIPTGVTLICGGGYHGKSTLLRAIMSGVYNKIPGDGRELCVAIKDAVTVRAEDGRSVNGTNISAFISNLPTSPLKSKEDEDAVDPFTRYFTTKEASGSTSQASNVSEAIESGAKCLLIDEDVSAANFMARDGRMRALVMDESITPLLYRVNGMYDSFGISTIVVVGGVGDWLDVPHQVVLLNRYVLSDATNKARSISETFSYGHIQYAGRGVVHRLPWDKQGTPHLRRPIYVQKFTESCICFDTISSNSSLLLQPVNKASKDSNNDDDDDDNEEGEEGQGEIRMDKCEQLLGKSHQLYGCILYAREALRLSITNPCLDLKQLVQNTLDEMKLQNLLNYSSESEENSTFLDNIGFAYKPREHEIAMAITRLRGIKFEEIVVKEEKEVDDADAKMKALAELWKKRRSKKA